MCEYHGQFVPRLRQRDAHCKYLEEVLQKCQKEMWQAWFSTFHWSRRCFTFWMWQDAPFAPKIDISGLNKAGGSIVEATVGVLVRPCHDMVQHHPRRQWAKLHQPALLRLERPYWWILQWHDNSNLWLSLLPQCLKVGHDAAAPATGAKAWVLAMENWHGMVKKLSINIIKLVAGEEEKGWSWKWQWEQQWQKESTKGQKRRSLTGQRRWKDKDGCIVCCQCSWN